MEPFYQEPASTIYCNDALIVLKMLPEESVQMCITSPPYWGLRNYAGGTNIIWGSDTYCDHDWGSIVTIPNRHESGETNPGKLGYIKDRDGMSKTAGQFCSKCSAWRGQLGLEPTPELYVQHLMMILSGVKRVLKKDGSFYLNIGDTYWGGKGQSAQSWSTEHTDRNTLQKPYHQLTSMGQTRPQDRIHHLIKPKCMTCIPEQVLFAMLSDGWILRNKIIWHKSNSMPSSVKDRFAQTWEYLYFFVKARKYYFDLDAVRVPHKILSLERSKHDQAVGRNGNVFYTDPLHTKDYSPKGKNPGDVWEITTKPSSISVCPKCDSVFKRLLKVCPNCGAEGVVGHFAPYPEKLCIDPIKASTRLGDTIVDCFAGGGTTGIAAKRLGRISILIDCVRPYCIMAKYKLEKVDYQSEMKVEI